MLKIIKSSTSPLQKLNRIGIASRKAASLNCCVACSSSLMRNYATFNFNQNEEDDYEKQPGQSPLAAPLEQYNVMQYDSSVTFISGYGQRSFFVGNTRIFGSIFATKKQVFVWDISDPSQITIESLKLAEHLNPTPTLLLVGTGKSIVRLPQEVHEYFRKNGVVIEEMNSVSAVSTFNVLNQEGRDVCCACISLEPVNVKDLVPEKSPVVFLEIRNVLDRRPGGSPLG